MHPPFTTIAVAAAALAAFSVAPGRAVLAGEPDHGVLLLHDGGVLQGRITRQDDRYRVVHSQGRFDVGAERVDQVCRSMADAYDRQRRRLPRRSVAGHFELAEWCLRYDMVPQATEQLHAARQIAPHAAGIAVLERRIAAASQQPAPQAETASQAPPPTAERAAAEEMQRLEAMTADLSSRAIERFTRKVQPLLVNSCTTSGCHQRSSEQQFQLDRALLHGLSNRRTTLRNLVATLELVDKDSPAASPLLTVPRKSHGNLDGPVFEPRHEEHVRQLLEWVAIVAEVPLVASSPSIGRSQSDAQRTPGTPAGASPTGHLAPPWQPGSQGQPLPSLRPRKPLQYGADLERWRPRDEFDPEIFNRQFHSDRESADDGGP